MKFHIFCCWRGPQVYLLRLKLKVSNYLCKRFCEHPFRPDSKLQCYNECSVKCSIVPVIDLNACFVHRLYQKRHIWLVSVKKELEKPYRNVWTYHQIVETVHIENWLWRITCCFKCSVNSLNVCMCLWFLIDKIENTWTCTRTAYVWRYFEIL